MTNRRIIGAAKLGLLLVAFLWGTSMTVVGSATASFPSAFILGFRFTVAAVLLAIIFHKRLLAVKADTWRSGIIIGLFLFGAYFLQTLAVNFTTPGRSSILAAIYCVIVPFLMWAITRVRPDKFNLVAAVICVVGVILVGQAGSAITTANNIPAGIMLIGDTIAVASSFLYAAHIVAISKLSTDRDPIALTIIQFSVAGILSWIVTLCFEDHSKLVFSTSSLGQLIYLAVFCTTIALLLQNVGQKYCPASQAAIILGSESVFGVVFPVMLRIESLNLTAAIGCIAIIVAIFISETKLKWFFKDKTELPVEKSVDKSDLPVDK
ncbi:DMT family transporter [Mageeibacillus indolicus]|jgi:hypothetical protein|uniref:EamA family transporter n=1 Tax=Mageeibacillus indolicus TaxID=884684 RepID=A0A2J8B1V0_9FIRM|nr:DMT family transporter [Mageeibacillus indolicus]PNH18715.1 EamA family transporter [Mageeibacillus indolicus]